jgi:hypothetical protein
MAAHSITDGPRVWTPGAVLPQLERVSASRLKRVPGRGGGEFQISNVGAET